MSLLPKGFTLIELLVVISILGIMSAVGLFTYTTVLNKARDTKLKADLDTIGKAYEFRYNFNTNTYGDVFPADFDSDQIPKRPDGSYYATCSSTRCFLQSPAKDFRICITLSNQSSYCRSSMKSEPSLGTSPNLYGIARYFTKELQGGTTAVSITPSQICTENAFGRPVVVNDPAHGSILARGQNHTSCFGLRNSPVCAGFDCTVNFRTGTLDGVGCTAATYSLGAALNTDDPSYSFTQGAEATYPNHYGWIIRVACEQ